MANQNNQNNDDNQNQNVDNGNENQGQQNQNNQNSDNGNSDNGNQNVNDNGSGGSNSNNDGGNAGNGEKTFTQSDVNRMMAKEKQQGRNAVFNELGINPSDSSQIALIKAFMAAQQQANGNDDGDAGNGNNEKFAELERRAQIAELKAEAMKAGVKSQFVDDAVDLVLARYTDDNQDFNAILNELKSKYAIWFEDTEEDDKGGAGKRGTGSTISSKNQQGSKNNQEEGLGKRLAGLRRPQTKKSSYFSS